MVTKLLLTMLVLKILMFHPYTLNDVELPPQINLCKIKISCLCVALSGKKHFVSYLTPLTSIFMNEPIYEAPSVFTLIVVPVLNHTIQRF